MDYKFDDLMTNIHYLKMLKANGLIPDEFQDEILDEIHRATRILDDLCDRINDHNAV